MDKIAIFSFFHETATKWVCENYSLSVRYLVLRDYEGKEWLAAATLVANPLSCDTSMEFNAEGRWYKAGQLQLNNNEINDVRRWMSNASLGQVKIGDITYRLRSPDIGLESDSKNLDRFEGALHLRVFTKEDQSILYDFSTIETELRRNDLPFDGLKDICGWLDISNPALAKGAEIRIFVHPPIELIWQKSSLDSDQLLVFFEAHPQVKMQDVRVSIHGMPGEGLRARRQIANEINWEASSDRLHGSASIQVANSDLAMVMVTLGNLTVRRHVVSDAKKARNARYLVVKSFDKDLEKLKKNLFVDKKYFEEGVSYLFFMLGFSSTRLFVTDGPDVILVSPAGVIYLVECTTAISDFSTKLGKLVGRRASVQKVLENSGHVSSFRSILVTLQRREEVAAKLDELERFEAEMLTREDLERFVDILPSSVDAEKLLNQPADER